MAKPRGVEGLHAELPLSEAAARTIRVRTAELFDHLARGGDAPDADAVHDARVATRRLRAALEVYRGSFKRKRLKPVRRDVKLLARALGARRDPDVQLLALERFGASAKEADWPGVEVLADRIRAERDTGDEILAAAVAHATGSDLRERLLALKADPDDRTPMAAGLERVVRARLDELFDLAPAAHDPADVRAQHDLRIAAKRLRYALEIAAEPCFGPYAAKAIKRVVGLQDLLGELHDCDVALPRIAALQDELRTADALEARARAGDADDLDPVHASGTPNAQAYRGLEALRIYHQARRGLLFERFLDAWRDLERAGFRARLLYALAERPVTAPVQSEA